MIDFTKFSGNLDKLKDLLAKNKKLVFARDKDGRSPIHMAAQNGNSEIVKSMLEVNAEFTQIIDSVSFHGNLISRKFDFMEI